MSTDNCKPLITVTKGQVESFEFTYSKEHIGKAQFKVTVNSIQEESGKPFLLVPLPIDKGTYYPYTDL